MLQGGFITKSAHIENLDPAFEGANIVRETIENAELEHVMSNSFGFGGTNGTLIMSRVG
jgi:3-oxoacyl-[acyl-carrier-protein] synthase-1